ncbi:hypothetical protein TVAG_436260 [Trichomonas vaginalis G3]|uniref:DUF3447 domain-containing protein n=1 Tax=Trichomonas vaginalis (strain ATCC PRA-98 / G3) TaxID=412133 RepID=A2G224_TRIV3|nr:spectrin binding [Trichomonas vaginalis G3]EAX88799.1 hypothetical protein TVAG_436260 [Trichomonas vaginalis G3]KAI5530055.1 spectrin binding [Trichomonas vaginalis G3]|eukprot:XP_001301729.1 hypothetical protein [Trichomonas vaginalis G3]
MNKYKEYIDTWNLIYNLNSDEINSTTGLYNEIKDNLIDAGYFTPQEMIHSMRKVGLHRLKYRHAYLELMKRIYEEYHCDNDFDIRSLSEADTANPINEILLNDDQKKLYNFLRLGNHNLNEILQFCCEQGAVNCFWALINTNKVQITKECLDSSFLGNNKEIIKECLRAQKPDSSTMENAIASHNMDNVMKLINKYQLKIPLDKCADHKNLQVFLEYLKQTNDINGCFVYSPAFHIQSLCEYFLSKDADINYVHQNGDTALSVAAKEKHNDIAKYLIMKGSDIDQKIFPSGSAFNIAVNPNNTELVELLNSHEAIIDQIGDITHLTSLHIATINNNKKVVEILISRGSKINTKATKHGFTPLYLALLFNHKEIAQLLISHGAKINTTDFDGNNAIIYALMHNSRKVKEPLLKQLDIICNFPDDYKNSLILGSNNNDMIEFLISNGAKVNRKNFYGNRPLHIAALLSNKEGAEILISHGAEINSLNKNGQTPLDIAVMLNKKTHEDILKNNKIEMNIVRENNIDFLDSLIEDSEMEALLKSHGEKLIQTAN